MTTRKERLEQAESGIFDVAIVGGGINGACAYDRLCRAGYRVLLLDKGDFAGATSQASGMMIWGGLLYLKNLDFGTVYKFSSARDRMIESMQEHVARTSYRYIAAPGADRSRHFVHFGLYLYWMIGHCRRHRPFAEERFSELELIREGMADGSLMYEESMLRGSDSRFVLKWIIPHQGAHHVPLNYCALTGGEYSAKEKLWHLELNDQLASTPLQARARMVINCAGIWTDSVNESFRIRTPYRHLFGKGVYITTRRPAEHRNPLVFEMGHNGDTLTYVPWGPVSMWGPTETYTYDLDGGFRAEPEDVRFLLEHMERNLRSAPSASDIISVRCGVRPLAVPKQSTGSDYPLDISRRTLLSFERKKNWISVYGGKLTGCTQVAAKLGRMVRTNLAPSGSNGVQIANMPAATAQFPGLDEPFHSIGWCMENEFCHTLDDYLRRRTNVAQWTRREGLGASDENVAHLKSLAMILTGGDPQEADRQVAAYRRTVQQRFDQLIARV